VGGLVTVLRALAGDRRLVGAAVVLCAGVGLVANVVQTYLLERVVRRMPVQQLVGQGLLPFPLSQTADRIDSVLRREVPSLPGAAIVLGGLDGAAIWRASGLRVRYENPSISVLDPSLVGQAQQEKARDAFPLRPHPSEPIEVEVLRFPSFAALEQALE
jgi:hypothetical protein